MNSSGCQSDDDGKIPLVYIGHKFRRLSHTNIRLITVVPRMYTQDIHVQTTRI